MLSTTMQTKDASGGDPFLMYEISGGNIIAPIIQSSIFSSRAPAAKRRASHLINDEEEIGCIIPGSAGPHAAQRSVDPHGEAHDDTLHLGVTWLAFSGRDGEKRYMNLVVPRLEPR